MGLSSEDSGICIGIDDVPVPQVAKDLRYTHLLLYPLPPYKLSILLQHQIVHNLKFLKPFKVPLWFSAKRLQNSLHGTQVL